MGPNTIETSTKAPLASLLITVKAIELEKVANSDMQNLRAIC